MLYLLFFASGLSALVYQVCWMKILSIQFGSTSYAAATVLSVFMAGLAVGAWWFGRVADRVKVPLRSYAAIEAGLGLYALALLGIFPQAFRVYGYIERSLHPSFTSFSLIKFGWSALILLVPTALMGATLPVLGRVLATQTRAFQPRLGTLYACNTLGAMVGCLGVSFWMILALGVRGSIAAAAAVNLAVAAAAIWLQRSATGPAASTKPEKRRQRAAPPALGGEFPDRTVWVVAFVSGFSVLAAEVIWTRLFINFLSGNVLIFATMVAGVLAGLAVGAFTAPFIWRRAATTTSILPAFLTLGGVALAAPVLGQSALGQWFQAAHQADSPLAPFALLFAAAAIPAAVLGVVFPTLLIARGRHADSVGSDTGRVYSVNTVGSVAGAFVAGFVLLPGLGVNRGLLTIAAVYTATGILAASSKRGRLAPAGVALLLAVAAFLPEVSATRYWYNGGFTQVVEIPAENTAFLEEGVTATVGVIRNGQERQLTVNGVIVAETYQHDLWDLLTKAHIPMWLHPSPRRVALVGLGAGVSLGAVTKYDVDVLDCIEISPEVVRASSLFTDVNQRCLSDPRVRLILNDGRHFLETTDQLYDVINVDPTDPPVCPLYTQDFFRACKRRLADGGLMVQWVPVFRLSPENIEVVFSAFLREFEHTTVWYNGTAALLIGTKGARQTINVEQFVGRASTARVRESLALIDMPDPWLLLSMYVGDMAASRDRFLTGVPDNTDDRPTLEYVVLRSPEAMQAKQSWTLKLLSTLGTPLSDALDPAGIGPDFEQRFPRIRAIANAFFTARVLLLDGQEEQARMLVSRTLSVYQVTPEELRCLNHLYSLGVH